jgi:hypothetical protein
VCPFNGKICVKIWADGSASLVGRFAGSNSMRITGPDTGRIFSYQLRGNGYACGSTSPFQDLSCSLSTRGCPNTAGS